MDKIRMLIPFKDSTLHEVTCSVDKVGQIFAPNSNAILDKNVVFIASEEDNGAILTRARHAGYRRIGE